MSDFSIVLNPPPRFDIVLGLPGPIGPTGPAGPQGDPGPASEAGSTYAEIYVYDNSTAFSCPSGTTFTNIPAFSTVGSQAGGATGSANTDSITITETGIYKVQATFSTKVDQNNTALQTAVCVGGTAQPGLHVYRNIQNANEESTASLGGFLNITSVPAVVDVRTHHNKGSAVNITVRHANLHIFKLA